MAAADSQPPHLPSASPLAKAAWPLLLLTAGLASYAGLSALLLPFLGEPGVHQGAERWLSPLTGLLQLAAAVAAALFGSRGDLRGATLAVAACLMLGWIELLPSAFRRGFGSETWLLTLWLAAAPLIAGASAALAWRNRHPLAAALLVTLPTVVGVVAVAALAVVVAVNGF